MLHRWLVMAAFFVPVALGVGARAEPSKPYNLVVIMTDEHNFRTLGCYREKLSREQALMWGTAVVETPHIDWIAHDGTICTSFYASTPLCSPSRSAFVSGRYPQNTPVITNNIPMSDGIVTFAELLRRRGYATGYAGKWHLDGKGKPQWAPKRRFGFEDNRYMFNRGHWKQLEDTPNGPRVAARDKAGRPTYSVAGANEKNFTTDFLTDRTVEFIAAHRDRPFCYMLSIPDPHGPDSVRPPYARMYSNQKYTRPRSAQKRNVPLPSWGQWEGGRYKQSRYYGMVRCIDDNVGKIIDALRTHKLLDRTIVVFTSDHGDLRGEHHRQNKGVPYEASARVPFLIRCPGKIKPGTVVNESLSSVDFLPTILSLMGVPTTGREEGRDASALLINGRAPPNWTDITFLRGPRRRQGWLAVVTDRFKLILSPHDPPWLFDLKLDPDEMTNAIGQERHRAMVRRLAKSLREYGRQHKDRFISSPRIRADLEWAINGTDEYRAPKLPK